MLKIPAQLFSSLSPSPNISVANSPPLLSWPRTGRKAVICQNVPAISEIRPPLIFRIADAILNGSSTSSSGSGGVRIQQDSSPAGVGADGKRGTRINAKDKRIGRGDSSLSKDDALPLPILYPGSTPVPKEIIDKRLQCNPEKEVASSSASERNWSTYSFIHSVKYNRLLSKRAENLVYVHSNLHLLSHKQHDYTQGEVKMWDIELEHTDLDAPASQLVALTLDDLDIKQTYSASASGIGSSNANVNDEEDEDEEDDDELDY